MCNTEIRDLLKQENIYLWEVADSLGVHETTLVKRFRKKLTASQREEVLSAIAQIKIDRCNDTQSVQQEIAQVQQEAAQALAEAVNSIKVAKPVRDPAEALDDSTAF